MQCHGNRYSVTGKVIAIDAVLWKLVLCHWYNDRGICSAVETATDSGRCSAVETGDDTNITTGGGGGSAMD